MRAKRLLDFVAELRRLLLSGRVLLGVVAGRRRRLLVRRLAEILRRRKREREAEAATRVRRQAKLDAARYAYGPRMACRSTGSRLEFVCRKSLARRLAEALLTYSEATWPMPVGRRSRRLGGRVLRSAQLAAQVKAQSHNLRNKKKQIVRRQQ